MIAGLILGLLLSAGSALLLPLIFPAEKKPNVSRDLQHAKQAIRVIGVRLERVSKAVEIAEGTVGVVGLHGENPTRAIFH